MRVTPKVTILIIFFIFLNLILILPYSTVAAQDSKNPTVVFNSPKGENVKVDIVIEVTFSKRMQQLKTEQAFSVQPTVTGSFGWNDRNLTFNPDSALDPSTTYFVTISNETVDLDGNHLVSFGWQFKTESGEKDKGSTEGDWWKTWEPIVTVLTIVGTAVVALVGYWSLRKKRSKLRTYIGKLDDVYNEHRKDPYLCEHKLSQLKEALKIKFRRGEMEENHYLILDKKIDDYLGDVRFRKTLSKPAIVKNVEKEIQSELKKKMVDNKDLGRAEERADKDLEKEKEAEGEKPKKPPKPKIIPDVKANDK